MAERRMLSKKIVMSDAFLDLPATARALYLSLSMSADDDGFLNNAKSILRLSGCSEDDLKILIAKKFLLAFDSGVIVIKHWLMNNYIQKDRYTPTQYRDEKFRLTIDNEKNYHIAPTAIGCPEQNVSNLDTECIQSGYKMYTQDSIDKSKSKDRDIVVVNSIYSNINKATPVSADNANANKTKQTAKKVFGDSKTVCLTDAELKEIRDAIGEKDTELYINRLDEFCARTGKRYVNCKRVILQWAEEDTKKGKRKAKDSSSFDAADFFEAAKRTANKR